MSPTDGDQAPGALPFDLLDGRYRLQALVGRGGMAAVYRALDTRLDRPVAVKLLGDAAGADDRRFRSEVRTLARFSHPHLVRLFDAGEVEGRRYLVMDLVEGTTVAARLRQGPLPPAEVATIGAGVAGALAYVHAKGIVHRDVKPANILIDARGAPFLADFGIARLVDSTGLTATGLLVGTPAYLAPEQLHGGTVDASADVYALGLVLLECLTGERAFTGGLSELAAARVLREPAIPEHLDASWRSVLGAMTAREPARRIGAGAVAERLSSGTHSPPLPPTVPAGAGAATATADGPVAGAPTAVLGGEPTLAVTEVASRPVRRAGSVPAAPWRPPTTRVALAAVVLAALVLGLVLGAELSGGKPSGAGSGDPHRGAAARTTKATHRPATSTTTATTLPTSSLATAAGNFVAGLVTGEAQGNVSAQAGQQLLGQLEPLLFAPQEAPTQRVQQFDQLVQVFDQDTAGGQITGISTVSSLTGSLDALAAALGTTVPPPATTSPAPPGNGPKGKGHGNANGNGNGNQGN